MKLIDKVKRRSQGKPSLPTRFSEPRLDEDHEKYVGEAKRRRGDSRLDRIVEVYRLLRREADPANWHVDARLRAFLTQTQYENPYIPAEVRERESVGRKRQGNPTTFGDAWDAAGLERSAVPIDAVEMEALFADHAKILDDFRASNIHDDGYFLTKLSEWSLTISAARAVNAKRIVDLGAAYQGFAEVATHAMPDVTVSMVDLRFPKGRSHFAPRIEQIGSDAGELRMFDDGSVDLVCAHNAFEHFSGDSDTRCVKEAFRILKPGGRLLITPIFKDSIYSLSINPFSAFCLSDDGSLVDDIVEELREPRVQVDYRPNVISPYSRRYDFAALQERVLDAVPEFRPVLSTPRFSSRSFPDAGDERILFGKSLQRDVFHQRGFQCLELHKP